MNKSLLAVLIALFVMSVSAHSIDEAMKAYKNDKCIAGEVDTFKPQISAKIAQLKENKDDVIAKAELISLVREFKGKFETCNSANKIQPQLGDVVEATGVAFLLASNCFKDVGIVFLVADEIVQDPTDVTNDVILSIFIGILGYQGYKDCSQFINFIL